MSRPGRARGLRARIAEELRLRRVAADLARHLQAPPAQAFASFGPRSVIVPPARVTRADCISVGERVSILEHSWLSVVEAVPGVVPRLTIGDGCRIGRFAQIACVGSVTFGRDVLTSERIFVGDTYHRYQDPTLAVLHQPMARPAPVSIGDGAFLGVGSAVLPGTSVGTHAYVAAGAVVTEDVPDFTLVVGNPARPVRRYDHDAGEWVACEP